MALILVVSWHNNILTDVRLVLRNQTWPTCHVIVVPMTLSDHPLAISSVPPSYPPPSPHRRHIEDSLGSLATQINFFIHNLAQMKFSSPQAPPTLLTFVPQAYSIETDGKIESAVIVAYYKRYYPDTHTVRSTCLSAHPCICLSVPLDFLCPLFVCIVYYMCSVC